MEYALPKFGGALVPLPNKLRVKNRIRYFVSVMRRSRKTAEYLRADGRPIIS
jgi:hypothetical protein